VFYETGEIRNDNSQHVQKDEIQVSPVTENKLALLLHDTSEEIQREHIKQKVHVILVDESGRDETKVLVSVSHDIRIEDQPLQHGLIAEGVQADRHSKADNDVSDGHSASRRQ
jgi:hypothetical protein